MGTRSALHPTFLSIALVLFALAPVGLQAYDHAHPSQLPSPLPADSLSVGAFVDSFFVARDAEHEGVTLAIVLPDGSTILHAFGSGPVQDPDARYTVFRGASVGKLIVATVVLQAVARGLVELDASIDGYLPELEFSDDPRFVPTMRHLLTHSAGVEDGMIGAVVGGSEPLESLASYFQRRGSRVALPVGRFVSYSNHGMALAALSVEKAAGVPFDELAQRWVFDPLGMDRTSFAQPVPPFLEASAAPFGFDTHIVPYPSGSLVTTASDMGQFIRAHLAAAAGEATRLPSDGLIAEAHRNQFAFHTGMPGMGLGFFETDVGGARGLFHTGLRFHSSILYLQPEQQWGFFLIGRMPEGGTIKADFTRAFVSRFVVNASPRPGGQASKPNLGRFTGYYRLHLGPVTTLERVIGLAGEVVVEATPEDALELRFEFGRDAIRLAAVDSTLFKSDRGAHLAFRLDTMGGVDALAYQRETSDLMTGSRIRWFERGRIHAIVVFGYALVFLAFAGTSVFGWVRARGRRSDREGRWTWRIPWAVAALLCMGPACLTLWLLINGGPKLHGTPRVFYLVTGFPTVGMALGLSMAVFSARAWYLGHWSFWRRAVYSAASAAQFALLAVLLYWNLLGFRF